MPYYAFSHNLKARNSRESLIEYETAARKNPHRLLTEVVFKNLGAKREEVVLGPTAGVDGSVLDFGTKSLIVSMDPITGAVERIGWSAVNVNANDIATFGVEPIFLVSCIMLPEGAERSTVETITRQMDAAAKDLGIAIVGATANQPGLNKPDCGRLHYRRN